MTVHDLDQVDQEQRIFISNAKRIARGICWPAGELGFIGLDYPEDLGGGGKGVLENVLGACRTHPVNACFHR